LSQENKALMLRYFEEAYNRRNVSIADEIHHPEFIEHPNSVHAAGAVGSTEVKRFLSDLLSAMPDLRFEVQDQIAERDLVVTRWRLSGTMKGSLFGFPPTGKSGTITGININRIRDGKAIEAWIELDMLGAMHQFGIIPSSEQSTD
jgi:predicted ester cyclase